MFCCIVNSIWHEKFPPQHFQPFKNAQLTGARIPTLLCEHHPHPQNSLVSPRETLSSASLTPSAAPAPSPTSPSFLSPRPGCSGPHRAESGRLSLQCLAQLTEHRALMARALSQRPEPSSHPSWSHTFLRHTTRGCPSGDGDRAVCTPPLGHAGCRSPLQAPAFRSAGSTARSATSESGSSSV